MENNFRFKRKKKELKNDGSDSPKYKIDIRLDNICKKGYIIGFLEIKNVLKKYHKGK